MHFLTYADNYAVGYFKKQVSNHTMSYSLPLLTTHRRAFPKKLLSTEQFGLVTSRIMKVEQSCRYSHHLLELFVLQLSPYVVYHVA